MNIKEIEKYGNLLRNKAGIAAEFLVRHMDKIYNPKTIEIVNKFKK